MKIKSSNKIAQSIINEFGGKSSVIVKDFLIGDDNPIGAVLMYISSLIDERIIDENILKPLMLKADESKFPKKNLAEYLCKKYLTLGDIFITSDIQLVIESINQGKSALVLDNCEDILVLNTKGGEFRSITDPQNESSLRGTREGFVENIETNIGILKRKITDKNFAIEKFCIGRRSGTTLAILYIKDIAKNEAVSEIKARIKVIDVDFLSGTGTVEQLIENYPYSPFPQFYSTERPDIVIAGLMEGQISLILNGSPFAILTPAIFPQFFQAVEDYYQRTLISSFTRLVRILATTFVILLPSIYLTLINYNVELIPIKFLTPISQSRQGIALSPFLEILSMELIIEFLREGGLRLPPKIAATLSIVGGIIIGNAAVESKLASPSTLLIVGVSTVASFLIPNYEMAISIRFIRFPMLLLADSLGFLGIAAGAFMLIIHLFSLENFGVDYLTITKKDLKDLFIRAPLWKMNSRPESFPNKNSIRQSDFRQLFRRKKNE